MLAEDVGRGIRSKVPAFIPVGHQMFDHMNVDLYRLLSDKNLGMAAKTGITPYGAELFIADMQYRQTAFPSKYVKCLICGSTKDTKGKILA